MYLEALCSPLFQHLLPDPRMGPESPARRILPEKGRAGGLAARLRFGRPSWVVEKASLLRSVASDNSLAGGGIRDRAAGAVGNWGIGDRVPVPGARTAIRSLFAGQLVQRVGSWVSPVPAAQAGGRPCLGAMGLCRFDAQHTREACEALQNEMAGLGTVPSQAQGGHTPSRLSIRFRPLDPRFRARDRRFRLRAARAETPDVRQFLRYPGRRCRIATEPPRKSDGERALCSTAASYSQNDSAGLAWRLQEAVPRARNRPPPLDLQVPPPCSTAVYGLIHDGGTRWLVGRVARLTVSTWMFLGTSPLTSGALEEEREGRGLCWRGWATVDTKTGPMHRRMQGNEYSTARLFEPLGTVHPLPAPAFWTIPRIVSTSGQGSVCIEM